jgi:hypothetical protein
VYVETTAAVAVKVPQLIHCVHCNTRFVSEMNVVGVGTTMSLLNAAATAEAKARRDLESLLREPKICDPVPCPNCFRYQPYMYQPLGFRRYELLEAASGMLCFGCLFAAIGTSVAACFFPEERGGLLSFAGGCLAVALIGWFTVLGTHRLMANYNPNLRGLERRERKAKARAMSPEEYDRFQAKRVSRDYRKYAKALRRNPDRDRKRMEAQTFPPAKKPWKREDDVDDGSLVVPWWVAPSFFGAGGTITIPLSETARVIFTAPESVKPGQILSPTSCPADIIPFKVRVTGIHVHPDEQRQE